MLKWTIKDVYSKCNFMRNKHVKDIDIYIYIKELKLVLGRGNNSSWLTSRQQIQRISFALIIL